MKKLNKILLILIAMLTFNFSVNADVEVLNDSNNNTNDTEIKNKFNYTSEDKELVNEVNGSSLVLGNNIIDNMIIHGINIILGNQIETNGLSEYQIILGNNIEINGEVTNDTLILGNNVTINEDAKFGRDVFIFASSVKIKGSINRNITVYASSIELKESKILGDVKLISESIKLKNSTIEGTLKYNENTKINSIPNNINVEIIKENIEEVKPIDIIFEYIWGLFNKLFTLLIMIFLIPKALNKITKNYINKDSIIKNIGIGLISVIIMPIVLLLLMFSTISISVSFIGIMLYVIFIMIATIISSFVLGNILWDKYIKRNANMYAKGLLGVVIYYTVSLIPYIGGFITFIFAIYGFGTLLALTLDARKN